MFCGRAKKRDEGQEPQRNTGNMALLSCHRPNVCQCVCVCVIEGAHSQATVLFHILVAATGDCVGEVPASVFNVASIISFCSHFHVAMGKTRSEREMEREGARSTT